MRVDLERLRRSLARYVHAGENAVPVATGDLAALVAVVDAARNGVRAWSEGAYSDIDCGSLEAALEPFTPERPDRAWEEVDRWNEEQAQARRDLAVRAAVDAAKPEWARAYAATRENDAALTFAERAKLMDATLADARQNPRDRARDQLADAGVTVQRQFRSDQERIAAQDERIAELERERDDYVRSTDEEWKRAEDAEARLARVPTLVEALRKAAAWLENGPPGELDDSWPLLEAFRTALAEWEKP